ncbi:MAG: glycoside hydrolase family 127 protein [Kiritimatiellia bacterium]|nr:glycoside hydrolase family 127 protein [Kiritimatiellia bacterium]
MMLKRFLALILLVSVSVANAAEKSDYPYQPVPFIDVKLTDTFWQPRIEVNRTVTIPFAFGKSEETGRIENFKVAGGLSKKAWTGGFGFNDSDVNKVIEGASYCLSVKKEPKLDSYLDNLISWYAAAQEDDGFLYTLWTARKTVEDYKRVRCRPNEDDRWTNIHHAHQLYNVGHMYEAGVAHYLATGKRTLLDVCIKNADLICKTFGPDGLQEPPGHQEIEIGLAKLYRVTGDRKYLDQAKFFLEMRGRHGGKKEYNQSHKPVLEQTEAVGHAVRANYMYSSMADVAALSGDKKYIAAIDRIWNNVVSKKLYVTGGTGSTNRGEAYGKDYELTNDKAYCETCAAIANVYWNHRMFLLHGDAKYIDVMERSLYNNVLSGVSFDGKLFFYTNVLAANESGRERKAWFGCACCPSNISRFIASVGGYMYAIREDAIYVNLYGQSQADIKLGKRTVKLTQTSGYPWKGNVKITVSPDKPGKFTVKLRLPGWARNQPVPSDLYHVAPGNKTKWEFSCKVNGEDAETTLDAGYAAMTRDWKAGDTVEVDWPLTVQRILCNKKVEANRGRAAMQRGPVVYCVEHHEVSGGQDKVANLVLPDDAPLAVEHRDDFLQGVTVITGTGQTAGKPTKFTAIPYYAWANREKGEMAVWLERGK